MAGSSEGAGRGEAEIRKGRSLNCLISEPVDLPAVRQPVTLPRLAAHYGHQIIFHEKEDRK
jgi:hypothetical protein